MILKKKIVAAFMVILLILCSVGNTLAISAEILYVGSAE